MSQYSPSSSRSYNSCRNSISSDSSCFSNQTPRDLIPSLMSLSLDSPVFSSPSPPTTPTIEQQHPEFFLSSSSFANRRIVIGSFDRMVCPISGMPLITVSTRNEENMMYSYNVHKNKVKNHHCEGCGPRTQETNLQPVYSVFCYKLNRYVIFARNVKAKKVEKFVFCSETGGLEQVRRDDLIFEEGISYPFILIGPHKEYIQWEGKQWKKQKMTKNGWIPIPPRPVKGLKPLENIPQINVPPLPDLLVLFCPHLAAEILMVRENGRVIRTCVYNELTKKFEYNTSCAKCATSVSYNKAGNKSTWHQRKPDQQRHQQRFVPEHRRFGVGATQH
ncbi:Protein CBG16289 [Caenorhabditis briggsae]|uniref:Protein CBG16289 n=1 Tax=Caenorhabditis briggsae TaxID=6238 RepID=A8XNQ7_CAEBR|nr:Protein CBG16289 [Caenorhabditis briggsae]CAP34146.2 Protein CBG16289 [Caenorhabditis briggsae]